MRNSKTTRQEKESQLFHIFKITADQAHLIQDLVQQIYFPTYASILPHEQIDFMLDTIYSVEALQQAINTDEDFYVMQDEKATPIGFMALNQTTPSILRIEKLYLLPSVQGKGCGRLFLSYAEEVGRSTASKMLELNVNRNNKAYYFYLKHNFKVVQEIDIPYFDYVLDDYIMQKEI